MRRCCVFFKFLLVLVIFSLVTPTNPVFTNIHEVIPSYVPSSQKWDYDALLQFIEEIEEKDIEDIYHLEDVDRIRHFVSFLAREGATAADIESIEEDVEDLLQISHPYFTFNRLEDYVLVPAVLYNTSDIALCKSFVKKVKHFVKKHKKAIIIGAAVAVAVVTVVTVCVAAPAAASTIASAAGAGAASASSSRDEEKKAVLDISLQETKVLSEPLMQEKIVSFKDHFIQEKFLELKDPKFPVEENGRILGRVFAHDLLDSVAPMRSYSSSFHTDNEARKVDQVFAFKGDLGKQSLIEGRADFYEIRGERALELGCHDQAISDFSKLIEYNAYSSDAYLGRAIAHLQAGQYENSMQDYERHLECKGPVQNTLDFSLAFAKALPIGVKDSGVQFFSFIKDMAIHPIDTGIEVAKAFGTLSKLVYTQEWAVIGETLTPEVYDLVCHWDSLSSEEQGKLAGYAFGKYGTDIFLPVASTKLAVTGVSKMKDIASVCSRLKVAERSLLLEAAAESGTTLSASIQEASTITSIPSIESLLEAGKAMDRAGLTKAGRALMKHGYRENSVIPKPVGNAVRINEQGQKRLEFILYHSEKIIYERPNPQFGKVVDIMVPGEGGVRFKTSGEMIGFLEPQR